MAKKSNKRQLNTISNFLISRVTSMFRNKKNKNGFTVAEVVVAAAIFIVFSGAVFSLYRMGSRMFVSGSWKFNRQKEAERFFEILKERVEQASNIVTINFGEDTNPSGDGTIFFIRKDPFELATEKTASEKVFLAEFAVCKPCIKIPGKDQDGLILCHSLLLVPNSASKLYDLHLYVGGGDERRPEAFFNSSISSIGGIRPENTELDDFKCDNATAQEFGLNPVKHSFILKDVYAVNLSYVQGEEESNGSSSGSTISGSIKPKIFSIQVKMRNPQHDKTVLVMECKAKIDGSVAISNTL